MRYAYAWVPRRLWKSVSPLPTPRHKMIIKAIVATAMTRHNVVERAGSCQVWETRLSRTVRARVSYHGGDLCSHRATLTVFRRDKVVFSAMRSQQLFPRRGFPARTEAVDVDDPGDWEALLFEKARAMT